MGEKRIPYATHLDILHAPLQVVRLDPLIEACRDQWYNQTLCKVNLPGAAVVGYSHRR